MNTYGRRVHISLAAMLAAGSLQAQWTSNVLGDIWMNLNPSRSVAVGTAPAAGTALTVRGDQMSPTTSLLLDLGSANNAQGIARWLRGSTVMGRIFHTATATNLGFNMQMGNQGGTVWLRNRANEPVLNIYGNGLRLIDDVPFTLNGFANNPRVGCIAIGHAETMDINTSFSLPISRVTLVHSPTAANGTASLANLNRAMFGYRTWMRNVHTYVGNGDLGFVG